MIYFEPMSPSGKENVHATAANEVILPNLNIDHLIRRIEGALQNRATVRGKLPRLGSANPILADTAPARKSPPNSSEVEKFGWE